MSKRYVDFNMCRLKDNCVLFILNVNSGKKKLKEEENNNIIDSILIVNVRRYKWLRQFINLKHV